MNRFFEDGKSLWFLPQIARKTGQILHRASTNGISSPSMEILTRDGSTSKNTEEFEYLRPLGPSNNIPPLAKLKSSSDMTVIKFAARCCVDAQRLLAAAGTAPRLRSCGSTDGQDEMKILAEEDTMGLHRWDAQGNPRSVRCGHKYPSSGRGDGR